MPYEHVATAKTPALIIYLIDVSGSMSNLLEGVQKIDHVNQAMENVLIRMVQRSTRGNAVSPRYRVALLPYSGEVHDMSGGIKTITEIVQMGKPVLTTSGLTNTLSAFEEARNLLEKELPNLQGHPAPMVCHLTDGLFTSNDPTPVVEEIKQMANDDGNVLVENIFLGEKLTQAPINDAKSWTGLFDPSELDSSTDEGKYAQKLFYMSSDLPLQYANQIQEEGYKLKPGCKMLFPGLNKDLVELAFAISGMTPTK